MQWLNNLVEAAIARQPDGEIIVESGISPSGAYHVGYLREIITCDVIKLELERRGRKVRHIHFVDDFDGFRKVPANLPEEYQKYLGIPLCDMPAPDGSDQSYADFALKDFLDSVAALGIKIDVVRSHQKYREGYFVPAIEKVLQNLDTVRTVLQDVSGRTLDAQWSPIQVNENGYLKKRKFIKLDTQAKTIDYENVDGKTVTTSYAFGEVKLDWRLDWPGRWWLVGVSVEPFGKDHGTKGGSYDTGVELMKQVFQAEAPVPVPYNFVNRAGDTKKMSASKGNGIEMKEVVRVLPPEVCRYFILRSSPDKPLFFDPEGGVVRLIDEFAALLAKPDKTDDEKQLLTMCQSDLPASTVSPIPFSHLVTAYQASLKDVTKTIEIIGRTEYTDLAKQHSQNIQDELTYIDSWLQTWAPEDVKFSLADTVNKTDFNAEQVELLSMLADKFEQAPEAADGHWFHQAIYEVKEQQGISPQQLFAPLYKALIAQDSGPRAGWFLSILPRDWLVKRLRFEA